MRMWTFGTYAVTSCLAAASLPGCGGLPFDSAQAAAIPQSRAIAGRVDGRGSWMSPSAERADLLYISDAKSAEVYVYRLRDLKLSGTLAGFSYPGGECSDGRGNVWITDASRIVEYAHGGTSPISVLSDPNVYAVSCSVDPSSGNLAVTNLLRSGVGREAWPSTKARRDRRRFMKIPACTTSTFVDIPALESCTSMVCQVRVPSYLPSCRRAAAGLPISP
jgi:hypothetical protein